MFILYRIDEKYSVLGLNVTEMHKIVWLKPFPCMICFIVWMHDEFTLCGGLFKLCWFLRAVIQGSSPCITQDVKSTETGFLGDITSENFVQSHFSRKVKLLFEDESFCADKNTHFFAFEVYFAWLQPSLPRFLSALRAMFAWQGATADQGSS